MFSHPSWQNSKTTPNLKNNQKIQNKTLFNIPRYTNTTRPSNHKTVTTKQMIIKTVPAKGSQLWRIYLVLSQRSLGFFNPYNHHVIQALRTLIWIRTHQPILHPETRHHWGWIGQYWRALPAASLMLLISPREAVSYPELRVTATETLVPILHTSESDLVPIQT